MFTVDVTLWLAEIFFVQPNQFDPESDPEGEAPEETRAINMDRYYYRLYSVYFGAKCDMGRGERSREATCEAGGTCRSLKGTASRIIQ